MDKSELRKTVDAIFKILNIGGPLRRRGIPDINDILAMINKNIVEFECIVDGEMSGNYEIADKMHIRLQETFKHLLSIADRCDKTPHIKEAKRIIEAIIDESNEFFNKCKRECIIEGKSKDEN